MKRLTVDELRQSFLDFFIQRGHTLVPSDSLVPTYDPSLLFSGAGMNQFKDEFLGRGKRPLKRACSSQKCLRTGDIDNVGVTPAHHTFFEMLGNFSLGDYFKREAIKWAWEFYTQTLGMPEERLTVSVYRDDQEAYDLWRREVGLPDKKIYRFDAHDNFWPADAPTESPEGALCGPCSEIFYDLGPNDCKDPNCSPACDCRRHVEIWNLVFQQFEKGAEANELRPLPQKNIDTGAGLERNAAVLQGVATNFEIDSLLPLVEEVLRLADSAAGHKYVQRYAEQRKAKGPLGELLPVLRRARRVADHARAVTFCLSDGVLPSNEGRGYVVRRLLRRAVLDGRALGVKESFVYSLVAPVAKLMARAYPEVGERRENLARLVRAEEEGFEATLERGQAILENEMAAAVRSHSPLPPGEVPFTAYDTHGLPVEIAEELIRDKLRSLLKDPRKSIVNPAVPVTEPQTAQGLGRGSKVLAIYEAGVSVPSVTADPNVNQPWVMHMYKDVQVILDRTPFGPVGDNQGLFLGRLWCGGKPVADVFDAQKIDGVVFHEVLPTYGTLTVGDMVEPKVYRAEIEAAMTKQRERARAGSKMVGADIFGGVMAEVKAVVKEKLGAPRTEFVREWPAHGKAMILAIVSSKDELVGTAGSDAKPTPGLQSFPVVKVILNKTPFYAESGGQLGDRGNLYKDGRRVGEIMDTTKADEIVVHMTGAVAKLSVGDEVEPQIDTSRRLAIAANHTVTHILHHYLRQVLGKHVEQSGSLVDDERLRLDFTHFAAVKPEELRRVEELVNAAIRAGGAVKTTETSVEEAKKAGAMALFGEKYGERVRMVAMELGGGERSNELCGGTHLGNVKDAVCFRIEKEESVAAGIRRITATTGRQALANGEADARLLRDICGLFKIESELQIPKDDVGGLRARDAIAMMCLDEQTQRDGLLKRYQEVVRVSGLSDTQLAALTSDLVERRKAVKKAAKEAAKKAQASRASDLAGRGKEIAGSAEKLANGVSFVSAALEGIGPDDLRRLSDEVRVALPAGVIFLASSFGGKALLVASVSDDLVKAGKKAGDIVKAAAKEVGGGGGGKPNMAQAGGPNAANIPAAIAAARKAAGG
jgi:alanyl-tRNA synthetase